MDTDKAVTVTQERLSGEGRHMGDLLKHFRYLVSPNLIGELNWQHILNCAERFPIEMGALPFGFEIPLHDTEPKADFGITIASGAKVEKFHEYLKRLDGTDAATPAILHLFRNMESNNSTLREITGRTLMLEYDIGSNTKGTTTGVPGMFLRSGERPIQGKQQQICEISSVVESLYSSVGWELTEAERNSIETAYFCQPEHTTTDSFGIFPARDRFTRLGVMGFQSAEELGTYLVESKWPGQIAKVVAIVERMREQIPIIQSGINIDVGANGLGPVLGLSFMVKKRMTKDSQYWLDAPREWDPFLKALNNEENVVEQKLEEIASWNTRPHVLFANTGRFVLLRGIHHIKLVVTDDRVQKVKAYLFLVLTGAITQ